MNKPSVNENVLDAFPCAELAHSFAPSTLVGGYLTWLSTLLKDNQKNPLYRDVYKPIIEANKASKKPVFASVVMRTQGRRPEALREALLCLYAQSDQDFEVLLIGHNLKNEEKQLVEQILDELDPEFRRQIRYLPLNHGNRTTPLNYGFAHAWGKYITVLDDDDLVFEDWILNFKNAAEEHPNTLLHSYVFGQKWDVLDTPYGGTSLRSTHAVDNKYCTSFNIISELYENVCPLIGIAFPAQAFHTWGMIFDETLTTTEDWDYMMRVSFLSGVTDIPIPGSIYRLWTNAESSATVHTIDEWKKNYALIQKKFKSIPMLLKEGQAFSIYENWNSCQSNFNTCKQLDAKLYYGNDAHWSEDRTIVVEEKHNLGSFLFEYPELNNKHNYHKLRWDPVSHGNVIIRGLTVIITDSEGDSYRLSPHEIHSNGEIYHDGILFLKDDPQVYFDIPRGFKLDKLTVQGAAMTEMPIWENNKSLLLGIWVKKILRKLHICK